MSLIYFSWRAVHLGLRCFVTFSRMYALEALIWEVELRHWTPLLDILVTFEDFSLLIRSLWIASRLSILILQKVRIMLGVSGDSLHTFRMTEVSRVGSASTPKVFQRDLMDWHPRIASPSQLKLLKHNQVVQEDIYKKVLDFFIVRTHLRFILQIQTAKNLFNCLIICWCLILMSRNLILEGDLRWSFGFLSMWWCEWFHSIFEREQFLEHWNWLLNVCTGFAAKPMLLGFPANTKAFEELISFNQCRSRQLLS